jgi:hypothetical protein
VCTGKRERLAGRTAGDEVNRAGLSERVDDVADILLENLVGLPKLGAEFRVVSQNAGCGCPPLDESVVLKSRPPHSKRHASPASEDLDGLKQPGRGHAVPSVTTEAQ